jgi:hypothetical protein
MVDSVIEQRFQEVIKLGEYVLENGVPTGRVFIDGTPARKPDPRAGNEWKYQVTALLEDVLGKTHAYSAGFRESVGTPIQTLEEVRAGLGIVAAAYGDFRKGHLLSLKELIRGELFDDYLQQASHLLENGYKDAAAVIAGGTLEEHLRQLCRKHEIETEVTTRRGTESKKASAMNEELKDHVYPQNDWRSVQVWLDVRNDAAHQKYDSYDDEKVGLMIDGIRHFLSRYPA